MTLGSVITFFFNIYLCLRERERAEERQRERERERERGDPKQAPYCLHKA